MIQSNVFKVPYFENTIPKTLPIVAKNVSLADNLMKFHIAPVKSVGLETKTAETCIAELNVEEIVKQTKEKDVEFVKQLDLYKLNYAKHEKAASLGEAEILFLGTGGAMPSKYRNGLSIQYAKNEY